MGVRHAAAAVAAALLWGAGAGAALAVDLRYMCYGDGNECEVMGDLLRRFEAQNPTVKVAVDKVPYKAVLESLPVQLAAGEGPDLARVSDLGGLSRYYLDLAPHVDRAYWEAQFGDTLPWFRATLDDRGIYGMMTQLTVTGGFANATLFEQAGVPMPGAKATWDEWAEAARAVAKATETQFPLAIDRSGHRIAAPAISYGAAYFDAAGNPRVVDDGFRAFATRFVGWHKDGTAARDVWAGQGGAAYQDAAQEFINGALVLYYSGSWQTQRIDNSVKDAFDWVAVGSPCGPAACSGMPGGAALVGLKGTKAPAEVAKVIDYFAGEAVHAELIARTRNVPAHKGLAAKGLEYPDTSPAAAAALKAFSAEVGELSPVAYRYQGYKFNRAMFNASTARLTQAIVGELSLDDALARIDRDVAEAVAAAK